MTLHFISYTTALGLASSRTGSVIQVPAIQFLIIQQSESVLTQALYLHDALSGEKKENQKTKSISSRALKGYSERMSESLGRYTMCTQELGPANSLLLYKLFKMVTCTSV